MRTRDIIRHEFVEYIPKRLEDGCLYVSIAYATAVHRCFCGCGEEVVTPLAPADWALTYDGETVTLDPSVGNWALPCKSHYWVRGGRVVWAPMWTVDEIEAGRKRSALARERYYAGSGVPEAAKDEPRGGTQDRSIWARMKSWFRQG